MILRGWEDTIEHPASCLFKVVSATRAVILCIFNTL